MVCIGACLYQLALIFELDFQVPDWFRVLATEICLCQNWVAGADLRPCAFHAPHVAS
jgi:hypothetical protein